MPKEPGHTITRPSLRRKDTFNGRDCPYSVFLPLSHLAGRCIACIRLIVAAAISGLEVVITDFALGEPTCFNITVETGTDMAIVINTGDDPEHLVTATVDDPISFPGDWCFNYTYPEAGTYDVEITVSNNRSNSSNQQTIDIDSVFVCNVTFNHSEFQVSEAQIVLTAPGATRTAVTIDYGDSLVLAEGYNGTECFDPAVGVKTYSHTYSAAGIYDVEVNMSNTQSSCSIQGVIGVNIRIVGLNFSNGDGLTNLTDPTFFNQTLINGSHIVCERHYDDQLVEINYCEDPEKESMFNHTYATEGEYNVEIICYNYLSHFVFNLVEYVEIPIENFTLNSTDILLYGGPLEIGFTLDQGTNVTVTGLLDGQYNASDQYTFGDLVGVVVLDPYPAGISPLVATAANRVSQSQVSQDIQIEIAVTDLNVTYMGQTGDSIYLTPLDNAVFNVSISNGTFPQFTFDYGHPPATADDNSFSTVDTGTFYSTQPHMYNVPDYYTVNFTASNNVSSKSLIVLIGSEYLVEDFTIDYSNVSDMADPVTFTVTDASTNTPSATSLTFDYDDVAETDEDHPLIDLTSPYDQPHTFLAYGLYNVNVTVANNVSSVTKQVAVQVGLFIEGLAFTAPACANTSAAVAFLAHADQGSVISYTFNPQDGVGSDDPQQEPPQDYSLQYEHTFTYAYPTAGNYSASLIASNDLSTQPTEVTVVKVENPVDGISLSPVTPQIISETLATFVFTAAGDVPTDATCDFTYDDGQTLLQEDMLFSGSTYQHTYDYTDFGDYNVNIHCSNCITEQTFNYLVQADIRVTVLNCIPSHDALRTNEALDLVCTTATGSRVQQELDDQLTVETVNVAELGTHTYIKAFSSVGNVTLTVNASNSASFDVHTVEVPVQDIVQNIEVSISPPLEHSCVNISQLSTFQVTHSLLPYPTDPHISYDVSNSVSGTFYSPDMMTTGTAEFQITFVADDIGNHSLSINASNLVSTQDYSIDFMVQKVITGMTLSTVSDNVAVGDITEFSLAPLIGSHGRLNMDWGDGTSDPYFFDGLLDNQTPTVQHIFVTPETVIVTASIDNCFTDPPLEETKTLTVQERVNMSNMEFIYMNPLTRDDKLLNFTVAMKPGKDPPTDAECTFTYKDMDNVSYEIHVDQVVPGWPYETMYTFPDNVIVQVELNFTCSNLVSRDEYHETLILEQPIEGMQLSAPGFCETFVECEFNILLTSGNNINYRITMGDGTPIIDDFELLSLQTRPVVHTYETEREAVIKVEGSNHISSGSAETTVTLQHSVETLEVVFENDGYVNLDERRLDVSVQVTNPDRRPEVAYITIGEVGQSNPAAEVDYSATHSYPITSVGAYLIACRLHNEISSKNHTQYAYGRYPISGLTAHAVYEATGEEPPNSRFLWNDERIQITAGVSQGTNVTYSFTMQNFADENDLGVTSYLPATPGTPATCEVRAFNLVSDVTVTVEYTVYMPLPLNDLRYNETTEINRTTAFHAVMSNNMVQNDPNNICFKMQFIGINHEYLYYRGPSKASCINDDNTEDVVDPHFERVTYSGTTLPIEIWFWEIEQLNFSIKAYDSMELVTIIGTLAVLDIPCESPWISCYPTPGPNSTNPVSMRRSEDRLFIASEFCNITVNCEKTDRVVVAWFLYEETTAGVMEYVDLNRACEGCTSTLVGQYIASNQLNYSTYIFNLTVTMGNYQEHSAWAPIYINVTKSPLVCNINHLLTTQVGTGNALELQVFCDDPDEIYDELDTSKQYYAWYCRQLSEPPVDYDTAPPIPIPDIGYAAPGSPGCFGTGPGKLEAFEGRDSVTLNTGYMHEATSTAHHYVISVKVQTVIGSEHDRWDDYDIEVQVVQGDPITFEFGTCEGENCGTKVNPQKDYTSQLTCTNCESSMHGVWVVRERETLSVLNTDDFVTNDLLTTSLVIPADNLTPGLWYLVEISATSPGMATGLTTYEIFVNRVPYGGGCYSTPLQGEALQDFRILCEGWMDDGFSMDPSFTPPTPAPGENMEDLSFNYFYRIGTSPEIEMIEGFGPLPQGDGADYIVTVMVRVVDAFGTMAEYLFYITVAPNSDPEALANALAELTTINEYEFSLDPIGYLNGAVAVAMSLEAQADSSSTSDASAPDATAAATVVVVNGQQVFVASDEQLVLDDNGEILVDELGNAVVVSEGSEIVRDANGDPVFNSDGQAVEVPAGSVFLTDDSGALELDEAGNPIVIAEDSEILRDPETNEILYNNNGEPVEIPAGQAVVLDANNNILYGVDGPVVAAEGSLVLTDPITNEILTNDDGSPVVVAEGSQLILDEDGNVIRSSDGSPVVLEPDNVILTIPGTNEPLLDAAGIPVQAVSGTTVVEDGNGTPTIVPAGEIALTFSDGSLVLNVDGTPVITVADSQPLLVDGVPITNDYGEVVVIPPGATAATEADGSVSVDVNNNPIFLDSEGNTIVTDPDTGVALTNTLGEPIALTSGFSLSTDAESGAINMDDNGNPVMLDEWDNPVVTDPETGDVLYNSNNEPYVLAPGTSVVTDSTGQLLLDENNNPVLVNEQGAVVETNEEGVVATDGAGNPVVVTTQSPGGTVATTAAPTPEQIEAANQMGAQVASIMGTISAVCSDPLPTSMALSIIDTCVVLAESMPALANDSSQLQMMESASTLTIQMEGNTIEDQMTMGQGIIDIMSTSISNMDCFSYIPEAPTTDPPDENLDYTPLDTPGALQAAAAEQQQQEEYLAAQETAASFLNETVFAMGSTIASALISDNPTVFSTVGLDVAIQMGGETGGAVASGDANVVFPPTVGNGSGQGQEIVYQVTNSETNVFSWDSSANDVQGALIINAFDAQGNRVVIDSPEPMEVELNNENLPTPIDFTNRTFNNVTGMLYAEMIVETEDNGFMFRINRALDLIPHTTFTVAIFFNATNTTDPDLGRPNLTSYDVLVELPGGDVITPAPTAPPLVRRRKRAAATLTASDLSWTVLIPQEYVLPGKLMMGIYIDDGTILEDTANYTFDHSNRTVPDFDFYVMLVRCRAFDGSRWSSEYCTISAASTMATTICECPPVTDPDTEINSYSSGCTGPQINSIDFANIFANFGALLAESWLTLFTVCFMLFVYTLLAIYVRRKDKADIARWTVAPLLDNRPHHNYFYKISVFTGMRQGAGTKSTICFIMSGEYADTGLRVLEDGRNKKFSRAGVRHFVMSTQVSLGHLSFLRIWHDNTGKGEFASWFLDKVEVEDLQTTYRYYFLNGRWLAVDEEDGQVQRMLPVANEEEVVSFGHLFNSTARNKLTDEHLWVSVLSRPTRSNFTRLQRLTCCLVLLCTTMIANAMFYQDPASSEDSPADPVLFRIGTSIVVSQNTILVSIYGSLVVVPMNMLIVFLFRKAKPKYSWDLPQDIAKRQAQRGPNEKEVRDILFPSDKSQLLKGKQDGLEGEEGSFRKKQPELPKEVQQPDPPQPSKKKPIWKQRHPLPYWVIYIAWVLCFISVAVPCFFIFMYGLEWGQEKSARWLTSLLLSFFQSVIVVQPIKVIVIAMLVSCIFKKLDTDDDELDEEDRRRNTQATAGEELLPEPVHDPNQRYFIPEPPDESVLRAARKKRDYDKMMWAIFKEIFFYAFFLCLICFIAWGTKDDMVYKMGANIHSQFQPLPENDSALYVSDGGKFWSWARETMIEALYNPRDYNGNYLTVRDRNYMSDQVSYKVGVPRMRQLRVGRDTCDVLEPFEGIVNSCRDEYTISTEEDRHFTMGWDGVLPDNYTEQNIESFDIVKRAFTYQSTWDLKGLPYWGKHGFYNGGGYVAKLSSSPVDAEVIVEDLRMLNWIDRYTRAVFVECTVFNPNTNLFAYISYLFEFPSMGSVMPFVRVSAFQLYANVGPWGSMVLAAQCLYMFILVYFIYHEIKKLRETTCRDYIMEPWNLYEVVLIITSIVGISMYAMKIIFGKVLTSDLSEDTEAYTNYMSFAYYDEALTYVIGTIVFLANLKFLRLLRFNRHIEFLSATLRKAGVELICFSITFFVFFVAYGLMGSVIFGQQLKGFRTFLHTLTSLYSMLLGKFDFNGIRQAQTVLGPIFFVTFVMSVYFVLVNMFLGILGIAFFEVRSDTSPTECDRVQFVSFTKEQAGHFSEALAESLKSVVRREDDEDDDDDRPKSGRRLVDSESIELQESAGDISRRESAADPNFGARPYVD